MHHPANRPPRRLGGLASRLAFALAVAALPGCGEHNATEPEDPTADPAVEVAPVGGSAADLGDEASAAAPTAGSSAVTAAATRLPKSFFVNPTSGNDANPGTQLKPFKTLAKGLSLAIAGDTMRLAPGLYSAAGNGEKFTTSTQQVVVPAGVKIFGTIQNEFTTFLHGAPGDLVGLNLKGAAIVRNLFVTGFPTGVAASQGAQSFKNVVLDQNQFGLKLSGSAKTTLTTSTVFVRPGTGSLGASVAQQAQLTVAGGRISAGGPNCAIGNGVLLLDAAQLTMKNGATLTNLTGTALEMRKTSKATLTGLARIERDFSGFAGCTPLPGVNAFDSTSFTLKNARILSSNGGNATTGIFWSSRALMTLDSAQVKGFSFFGLHSPGNLRLVATSSVFQYNNVGINVTNGPNSSITMTGSTLSNNVIGIHAPNVRLRRTLVTANQQTGVLLASASGNDLGLTTDLGHNLIAANGITGVAFDGQVGAQGFIFAAGNSWTPNTQGTNGSGLYPQMVVTGMTTNPPASGKNFTLPPNLNFKIQL
jgi:Protein of unknown function (DUF1565)/Right handed beta helix region